MVSEAIFPTNRGYICIEKWSQIFVSGIGSVHSESEEKTLFQLKKYHNKSGWQMLESTLLADVCLQISNINCYGISYMIDNFFKLVSFWYNLDLLLACPVNSG